MAGKPFTNKDINDIKSGTSNNVVVEKRFEQECKDLRKELALEKSKRSTVNDRALDRLKRLHQQEIKRLTDLYSSELNVLKLEHIKQIEKLKGRHKKEVTDLCYNLEQQYDREVRKKCEEVEIAKFEKSNASFMRDERILSLERINKNLESDLVKLRKELNAKDSAILRLLNESAVNKKSGSL